MIDLPDFASLTEEELALRDEVRAAIARHRPSREALAADSLGARRAWQRGMADDGWVGIGWPREHGGRSADQRQQAIYNRELALSGAPPFPNHIALNMLGPTLIQIGDEAQKERFLVPARRADELWCQLFSEPDSGSDLASLRTRGRVESEEIVLTGTKIWITNAHHADFGFALVRTDPDAADRHAGLTYVLVDMHADGVTINPIVQNNGQRHFNEVVLDEVRVPLDRVVGEIGDGWRVARATLDFERSGQNNIVANHRTLQAIISILADPELATGHGNELRSSAAWAAIKVEGLRRIGEDVLAGGPAAGAWASAAKLIGTELRQELAELAVDALGGWGVVTAASSVKRKHGNAAFEVIAARQATMGGGTSEIQRNIIGERILGLPRDPGGQA